MFWPIFSVCFGAPVTTAWSETGTFCCLLVLLSVYPVLVIRGTGLTALRLVLLPPAEEDSVSCSGRRRRLDAALYLNSLLSLGGAWAGAAPIPLDWDTPWQAWPVSCCLAAMVGHICGNVWGAGTVWPRVAQMSAGSGGGSGHSSGPANKRKYV